jgi:hypothetical protein
METKGNETAGELLFLKAALMTDLGIEFGEVFERVPEVDDFHPVGIGVNGVVEQWSDAFSNTSSTPVLQYSIKPIFL